jgi:pyruvate/2-oxoglutarate dehydrogenase complex dihydrolipoamide acyltransferase (E2) component
MTSPATESLVEVTMPQMGTSITEGTVIAWLKQAGDPVTADEPICEISTDKVDSECPAPVTGTLVEVAVAVGEVVPVGALMAKIAPGAAAVASGSSDGRRRRFYSPVARRIAAAEDVDLDRVTGSGLNGRVTRKDVENFIVARARSSPKLHSDSPYKPDPEIPAPPPGAAGATDHLGGEPRPLSRMRVAIGAAMRASQGTAATCHTVVECDVTGLEARRRALGSTALPFVARAVIETLGDYPNLNATLAGETITHYRRVHLGIAVSLGDEGLIVPVIKDAQELSAEGLGERIKDLARRARGTELHPEEVQGGTFTITNPGAFGASIATPIINLPQVAILDLEAVVRRPVVVGDAGAEALAIRSMMNLVLGWDHRAIDGVYAARFLSSLRDRLAG